MEATITSKGQITLPKSFRDKYNLKTGEKLVFIDQADGTTQIIVRRQNIQSIIGILKPRANRSISIEEMSDAAQKAAVNEFRDAQS